MPGDADGSADPIARADDELARIDRELAEIALLDQQARAEAARLEQRRAEAADRLTALAAQSGAEAAELREATDQLIALTRRTSMMEAQGEVLDGKRRALERARELIGAFAEAFRAAEIPGTPGDDHGEQSAPNADEIVASRAVLAAQEDLRRDIARAMHDGPAQSLTNVLLQAQIVQRLAAADPAHAADEAGLLKEMVEKTLEATKAFIFEVRPMVLDDLGLVPALRRTARDRGRQGRVRIEFDSLGADRRLTPDVESAFFRVLDDAVVGFLETEPAKIAIRLDWSTIDVRARVEAFRADEEAAEAPATPGEAAAPAGARDATAAGDATGEMPPALAAMIDERRESERAEREAAAETARRRYALPAPAWRDIQQLAAVVGLQVALSDDGRRLNAVLPVGD